MAQESGTLYLVATPIGNLEDMTFRAVRVLGEVALIACEDTRQTSRLLQHYRISTRVVSSHEHNEASRVERICARLEQGESVAVVTDAGTPLVSDPGYRLARAATERGFRVVAIPGASAILAALSVSALPCHRFAFFGFPPPRPAERLRFFGDVRDFAGTAILFEAPHRILFTLKDLEDDCGDPPLALARELTKVHEEVLRGRASELRHLLGQRAALKGEMTLVVDTSGAGSQPSESLEETVRQLEAAGTPPMEALKAAARKHGVKKRDAYARMRRPEQPA